MNYFGWLTLVAVCSPESTLSAQDSTDLNVRRDLTFAKAQGEVLRLDLRVPKEPANPPLVVWIHGGGWRAGSKNNPRIGAITQHGYALASISYRFTDKATFPAQVHDCKAAIRWLRANATRFGYDADWIAVAGSSAGGHLALLLGLSGGDTALEGELGSHLDQSSTVQAIIDYFGPSDFVLRGQTQPERAYTQLSGSFALMNGVEGERLDPEVERFASPASYVSPDDPPLLIFHGDADKTVLLDQSQHIDQLYKDAGLSSRLVVLKDAGHGGKAFFDEERLEMVVKFLDAQHAKGKSSDD